MSFHRLAGRLRSAIRTSPYLALAMVGFLTGFLVFSSSRFHSDYYYVFVLLPFLISMRGADWVLVFRSRSWWLLVVLMSYIASSIAWSGAVEWGVVYDRVRHILAVLSFVVIISWITYKRPQWVRYLFILMAPVAVFAALFSLYQLNDGGAFVSRRLYNVLSYRENPNSAAVPFALMGVGAFYFMVKGRSWWIVALSLLALVVCSWFLFLTQSRAAILYVVIGVFTILLMWRSWWVLGLALGFSALCFIYINFGGVLDRSLLERGGSGRLEIWMAVVDRFLQAPIFGEGVGNPIEIAVPGSGEFHSAHNLWLSTVLAGGAVGLVLLLAVVSSVFLNARSMRGRMPGDTLVVGWLIAGLALLSFDGHGLVVRMNPHYWLGLWLPVGMIIGWELRSGEGGNGDIRALAKRCLNSDATVGRQGGA